MLQQIRKWRQRRRLIYRIDWAQFHLEMDNIRHPAGNEYLERLDTLDARRKRLTK